MNNAIYTVTTRTIIKGEPEMPYTATLALSEITKSWPLLATAMTLEPRALSISFEDQRIDLEWCDHGKAPSVHSSINEPLDVKGIALVKSLAEYAGEIVGQALNDLLIGAIMKGTNTDLISIHNRVQKAWEWFK